ncbi:MAG: fumarate/nitrate reduction transcriptional regulator Fnr [Gammaproteobacteria bacterium]|nr:fumarate/nitrate reduction transcriptional regulator Fnr [Gammaproteobacteria bacterium]
MTTTTRPINLLGLKVSCRECSLAELCLPRALTESEISELEAIVRRGRTIERGQHIFESGDPFEALYVVRSGSLKACMTTPDGLEQIVGFHLPGELVGLDAFHGDHHHCSAEALETTSLCALPADRLEQLSLRIPSLNRELHRLLGREVAMDQELLLLLGKATAEVRIAAFLVSLSKRYGDRGFSTRRFNLSLSRHEIGNYLGLALETVSRQFAKLQSKGIVGVNRREIEIYDMPALHALVGECGPAAERLTGC